MLIHNFVLKISAVKTSYWSWAHPGRNTLYSVAQKDNCDMVWEAWRTNRKCCE